jgi:hypothetical protein
LSSRIQPLAKDSAFLNRLLEASADRPWALAPIDRVYPLVAPPRQWPEKSGVQKAMRPESDEEFGVKELIELPKAQGHGELKIVRDVLFESVTAFSRGPPLKDVCTLMVIELR